MKKISKHAERHLVSSQFLFLAIGQILTFLKIFFPEWGITVKWPMPILILWKSYFTTFSTLKFNNSKTTHQNLTNLTFFLENMDKTMFVDHNGDILRPLVRTSRQPQ